MSKPSYNCKLRDAVAQVFAFAQDMTGALPPDDMDDWRDWLSALEPIVQAALPAGARIAPAKLQLQAAPREGTVAARTLELLRDNYPVNVTAPQVAEAVGCAVSVATTTLSKLVAEGAAERVDRGQYRYVSDRGETGPSARNETAPTGDNSGTTRE